MSFLALAIILLTLELLKRWPRKRWTSFWKKACDTGCVSCALMLGMAPVTAAFFGQVSYMSPLSNLCVIPLMTLGLCGGLALIGSYVLGLSFLASVLVSLERSVMALIFFLVDFWASWGVWSVSFYKPFVIFYYMCVLCLLILVSSRRID